MRDRYLLFLNLTHRNMNYQELMTQIEKLFKKAIPQKIHSRGEISEDFAKSITVDVLYTEIMLLGYCFGNIEKTLAEMQKRQEKTLGNHLYEGLKHTAKKYSKLVQVFSRFHLEFENGLTQERLIENTILNLNNLT